MLSSTCHQDSDNCPEQSSGDHDEQLTLAIAAMRAAVEMSSASTGDSASESELLAGESNLPLSQQNAGVSPFVAIGAPEHMSLEKYKALGARARAYEARVHSPIYRFGKFWTCSEIIAKLPHVMKLWETYRLFVRPPSIATIDILKVGECLRAMGANFEDTTMKASLVERLLTFPHVKPATSANFELVLAVYSEVIQVDPVPDCDILIKGLSCYDSLNTGKVAAKRLRRILTTMGQRLSDGEVSTLLDSMTDAGGDVDYVTMMKTLFPTDTETPIKLKQVRMYLTALGKHAYHMDLTKRDDIIRALRKTDKEKTGYVNHATMIELLEKSGENFTVAELVALASGISNDEKKIHYRHFLQMIMNN